MSSVLVKWGKVYIYFIFKSLFAKMCVTESESFSPVSSASLREENKMLPGSEYGSQQVKNASPNNGISHREEKSPDSDSTLEELSDHSLMR